MNATRRDEIGDEFDPWLNQLQFYGTGLKDGRVFLLVEPRFRTGDLYPKN